MASNDSTAAGVLVFGLGRFGSAIADTLDNMDVEVLGVERDPGVVERWSKRIPCVEADGTDPRALEQIGAADFAAAVVGVGTSLEASVLITGNLVDIGVPEIWAKATSTEHKRILERIGAHHVVLPEAEAGARIAHSVGGNMLDYIEVEDGFTIVKMSAPKETHHFTLDKLDLQGTYGVHVIGVKRAGEEFEYATPDTLVGPEDLLVVAGEGELLERFAQRP
ncbi:potassium channel family protein [Demequina mangrovi]|uniref:Trk system potassium uptake protein TrkA n=1 Tax=Demequina mangrovi TaxID=1043493 RepID=A0A1H6W819_9MICO|nr:TrkA family potassium uptake protein [Demequina mangrovi]SEJ13053.1 trk system potassium uptake protein TrkA [Demequina mangrovi]